MKKVSTALDTKDISLTIYNGGFGAVKEIRKVSLTGNETELVFADVAQKIETDSLLVDGINVLEFNYDYDLVDKSKLLQKYIDKEVVLMDRKTGLKKSCRLLSVGAGGSCVLEDAETKEIYIDTNAEIILPSLPSGLIVKPALVWKIAPSKVEEVKVSYLSEGFNWTANYVVELLENTLNIAGWAQIDNQSGSTFENAKVKLIAGDVNRVEEDIYYNKNMILESTCRTQESQAEEKSFFDYHMYTLKNKTTLKDNQTKQINILNGEAVSYRKFYRLDSYDEKANVIVSFENRKANGLGIALPEGKIKLYQADSADGSLEFLGEDSIEHTPKDEEIELNIGNAFDITFESHEVKRRRINGFDHYWFECLVKNHKDEAVRVQFEQYNYYNAEMVQSSHVYVLKTSGTIGFDFEVSADSETMVSYEQKVDRRTEIVIKKD